MAKLNTYLFDATLHINVSDGSLHVVAYDAAGRCAERRFPPAQALAVKEWLRSPATWADLEPVASAPKSTVCYSHESGKIVLTTHRSERVFDPLNDESLAKLVRHLKSLAPIPHGEPLIPDLLPEPTEEELARRTIYTKAMPASGYGGTARRGRKSGPAKPAASAERTAAVFDDILANLVSKL